MKEIELIAAISDETCIPRAEVEVTLGTFFKIIKGTAVKGEILLPGKMTTVHPPVTLNFYDVSYTISLSRKN